MLIFMDGFDHYAFYDDIWTASAGGVAPEVVGRGGSKGFFQDAGGRPRYLARSFGTNYSELIMGVAVQANGAGFQLFGFEDSGTVQLLVLGDTGGVVRVYRGQQVALLGSTPGATYAVGAYHYWELHAVFANGTSGSFTLYRDGENVLTVTGIDTSQSGNTYANGIFLGDRSANTNYNTYYDDVYVFDTVDSGVTGAPNNAPLGDVRVETLYANGNGNSSQLDGSDGNQVDNYLLVDETPYDDDTTYVESADAGEKDTYAYGNLATTSGYVYAMQITQRAKKTDVGTRAICSVTRFSGVEEDSADKYLATSYVCRQDIREADSSGNQLTIASVNGMEVGTKVTT